MGFLHQNKYIHTMNGYKWQKKALKQLFGCWQQSIEYESMRMWNGIFAVCGRCGPLGTDNNNIIDAIQNV